ncbi:hypothetical protein C1H46_043606 [Malus baccata]|uniref:Uncharacterized protein n=1 Tax=Malus baccata TaxID=106549 RepID=A0A540K9F2_MALBA|nr:hypothetical protein C1H46_043606 [Malus baccata]
MFFKHGAENKISIKDRQQLEQTKQTQEYGKIQKVQRNQANQSQSQETNDLCSEKFYPQPQKENLIPEIKIIKCLCNDQLPTS